MTYHLNLEDRFTHHPPNAEQIPKYEDVRARALEFARFLTETCPSSPELTRAVNAVDEAVMLANAAIARHS